MRELSLSHMSMGGAEQSHPPGWFEFQLWRKLNLVTQFTIVAAVVVAIVMITLGRWASARIESSVIRNTAASAALYMDRFVEPYVQDLTSARTLSDASQAALSEIIKTAGFRQHVIKVKIWRRDGTIVYSNDQHLIGMRLPVSESLDKAFSGAVAPEFNDFGDDENADERVLSKPLLEIYAPIRAAQSDEIIAVAEFYQTADELAEELAKVRRESMLMVGGLSLLMLGGLIGIVARGNRTIVTQQAVLNDRIAELSVSLAQNVELRKRINDANRRASESNERFLRRVSAELHDGPVQLVSLALLRLDGIRPLAPADDCHANDTLEIVRSVLQDAMSEIRDISRGLALPEIETLSLSETLELAVTNHERRTGTQVDLIVPESLPDIPASIKTCAYRFVQEGLNNAFRHANGLGQRVAIAWDGRSLSFEVADSGPGFAGKGQLWQKSGMGLAGLRDRIESLGGSMIADSAEGQGARLHASFSLKMT